ncbi:MAG TPA: GGDEF domain-containing protein [Candidatus Acidoferrales bacterium]|jgi:diguanylate cyclase (GGDEF)-like protein|nr:GGDEF domain-containing protein [Candidatus Acidoferrales bacterium]
MPQPTDASPSQPSADDSFLDLLVETLEGLDETVRGQFLRQFFHTIAKIDLPEQQSSEYWRRILQRRRELSESLGRKVALATAMVDVLASTNFIRVPIVMEYEELKKLQINAATDSLTGLYNRRLFDEYCDKELNRAKRYGQHLAIVILDLHRLKEVNDRHGHLRGDHILQLAATMLRRTLRAADFAFRIGGDEFALLLPQTDTEQAVTLCRRVRSLYEAEVSPLKIEVGVTLDFGVAVHPQDGDQKSALLHTADERLYELKRSGRAPRVVPIETHPARESAPPAQPAATAPPKAPAAVPPVSAPQPAAAPPAMPPSAQSPPSSTTAPAPRSEHRKWERVSLGGTKAHAVLTDVGQKTAKVIDLSYGGVALLFDKQEDIPDQFNAVLHVPILPPVRVILRKSYILPVDNGRMRVGCSFVS